MIHAQFRIHSHRIASVVIAIMAILAALLLPALSRAKAQARSAR